MNGINIKMVRKNDAQFLHDLMNNESIMTVLNEVPTAINVWADAIIEWGGKILMKRTILFSMNWYL